MVYKWNILRTTGLPYENPGSKQKMVKKEAGLKLWCIVGADTNRAKNSLE